MEQHEKINDTPNFMTYTGNHLFHYFIVNYQKITINKQKTNNHTPRWHQTKTKRKKHPVRYNNTAMIFLDFSAGLRHNMRALI